MKLIWTDPSIADLRAIRDYVGRDSDYYAPTSLGRWCCPWKGYCSSPGWEGWFLKPKMKTFVS
jgi:hypothetical protein